MGTVSLIGCGALASIFVQNFGKLGNEWRLVSVYGREGKSGMYEGGTVMRLILKIFLPAPANMSLSWQELVRSKKLVFLS